MAGRPIVSTGFGIIGDIVMVSSAPLLDLVVSQLGIHLGAGILSAIINAIGALLLLLIIRLVRGGGGSMELGTKLGQTLVTPELLVERGDA
jgi:hypothetical protein